MMNEHLIKPDTSSKIRMSITPETAGWTYLSYAIVKLGPGETHQHLLDDQETAIVPLEGSAAVTIGDVDTMLSRTSVFDEMPRVGYAPPGTEITVSCPDQDLSLIHI